MMIIFGLSCCKKKQVPEGILTRDEMVAVMSDLYITEQKISTLGVKRDSLNQMFDVMKEKVFAAQGITDSVFRKSMDYYMDRPLEMETIYTSLVDSLNLREQRALFRAKKMIYPDTLEQKLGFDQIREKLKKYCSSPAGEAWVDKMHFNADAGFITTLLKQNLEFKQILEKGEPFPSRYFSDPTEWLQKISIEGNWLEAEEFLNLAYSLETIIACRVFLSKSAEVYPELFKLSKMIAVPGTLHQLIFSKIDDKGLVRDNATAELARIRKKLRDEQARLRRLADQIFRTAVSESWVPEGALPTIRDGRVVIPIQAEHKRKIKGFILDESATGQTIFLEPTEMLDANNEIRELEHSEKREVIRILTDLTNEFRIHLAVLRTAFQFLSQIDFIRAKAKFAIEVNADLPLIENNTELVWYNARHPLLYLSLKGKREIVPLSIELDQQAPNASGFWAERRRKISLLENGRIITIHGPMRTAHTSLRSIKSRNIS